MSKVKRLPAPDLAEVRRCFSCGEAGVLINKVSRGSQARVGEVAGNADYYGYTEVGFNKRTYKAHHLVYYIKTGIWPEMLDHINGNKSDNRIENLREASLTANNRNQKLQENNTTGVTGVYFSKNRNKWRTCIYDNSVNIHLGYFVNFEDAVKARKAAEVKYGYHENHGTLRA